SGRGQRPPQSAVQAPAPSENSAPRTQQAASPGPQPLTVTVREAGSWPRTATTTLTLNPFTGNVLRSEGFADLSTARQVRSWTRFLHTGQALGWGGQLVAGLACLGALFLVYTGFALSWRRFFAKRRVPAPSTVAVDVPAN
ncbi:MAG: PepSY domain-containing protein, partial [Opitutaceae bacterium]|nr:PepSY domain-containing protein [Opitutaceae bacterium]